jgi:hypothetical protein
MAAAVSWSPTVRACVAAVGAAPTSAVTSPGDLVLLQGLLLQLSAPLEKLSWQYK